MAKLYWPLIAACFYTGFRAYPIWTILPLGVAATIAFFIVTPDTLKTGMREPGAPYYILAMVAGCSVIVGILFSLGWLVGQAVVLLEL
jgi:hypothetical protein